MFLRNIVTNIFVHNEAVLVVSLVIIDFKSFPALLGLWKDYVMSSEMVVSKTIGHYPILLFHLDPLKD